MARMAAGKKDPLVAWILFSRKRYEIPRTIWSTILVIKKEIAKRVLLLRCGNSVVNPRTNVGISIDAHRQNIWDHERQVATSTISIYAKWWIQPSRRDTLER